MQSRVYVTQNSMDFPEREFRVLALGSWGSYSDATQGTEFKLKVSDVPMEAL